MLLVDAIGHVDPVSPVHMRCLVHVFLIVEPVEREDGKVRVLQSHPAVVGLVGRAFEVEGLLEDSLVPEEVV